VTNTTGGTTPAGWYPVTPGSSQLRWWDGTAWTDHVHDQAVAQVGGALKAPAGTNPNTVWVWILAVLPLLGLASLFLFNPAPYFRSVMSDAGSDPTLVYRAEMAFLTSPGYLILVALGFVTYAITVLFAGLDWRQLKVLGVPKPFHWAWTFLPSYGQFVYMIGRFVIVKRRTGTGLAPLWVWIATIVVVFIAGIVWAIALFASLASMVSNLPTT
jgi:Protein of unknown function (DUF2510)